jgi:hypothetical protein
MRTARALMSGQVLPGSIWDRTCAGLDVHSMSKVSN